MFCAVKRAVLLLLVAAAIGSQAAPDMEDCGSLNKTLPAEDLHKIFGDWVLVYSTTDNPQGWNLFPKINSSHVELRLLADNTTIVFDERNFHFDNSCSHYILNFTVSSADDDHHTLQAVSATVEKDGVSEPYTDLGKLDLYESCSDCLNVVYKSQLGQFLLIYRREGHHGDVAQLEAALGAHRNMTECVGLPLAEPFIYDGVSDFCHKKSSPEVKEEES